MFKISIERKDKWTFKNEKDIARNMACEIRQISEQLFANIRKFGFCDGNLYNSIFTAIDSMKEIENKYSVLTSYDN